MSNQELNVREYFAREIMRVFADCLQDLGMVESDIQPTSVTYANAKSFVRLYVFTEEKPKYLPRVSVGPLPLLGNLVRQNQIDIQHTVPCESPLREYYILWIYSNEAEMKSAFINIRDQIFKVYTIPYLLDCEGLVKLVETRANIVEEEWLRSARDQNDRIHRRKANEAFSSKRYVDFVKHIENIPEERLSELERKKLDYAKRHLPK